MALQRLPFDNALRLPYWPGGSDSVRLPHHGGHRGAIHRRLLGPQSQIPMHLQVLSLNLLYFLQGVNRALIFSQ